MNRYEKIRDDNLKEQTRRFNEVMEKYSDIRTLLEKRRQLQSGFDLVLSSDTAFSDYTKRIREINKEVKELLKKNGLPENYLEPIYHCPVCEDKGYYFKDEAIPVRCKCNSDIGFGCSFKDFDLELFSKEKSAGANCSPYENMSRLLQVANEYCENFPDNPKANLLFYGTSGLGKSFLASCMCSRIKERGFSVIKVNAFKLIDDFKAKHLDKIPYPADYFTCDFLVIDDIGTEPMYNNITVEYLFSLINERIEQGLATVFVTNQSFENCVARYDERLASRMFDKFHTIPLAFIGTNLRLK